MTARYLFFYGIERFRTYLQHRHVTLATDCTALTLFFTRQNLSSKMHPWALRLMQFDVELGEDHAAPDALPRLRRKGPPELPVDGSFPDDTSSR